MWTPFWSFSQDINKEDQRKDSTEIKFQKNLQVLSSAPLNEKDTSKYRSRFIFPKSFDASKRESTTSINLKPKLILNYENKVDTLFGFNTRQTSHIMRELRLKHKYQNLASSLEDEQINLDILVKNLEGVIASQGANIEDQRQIVSAKDEEIEIYQGEISDLNKKVIKYKNKARGKFWWKMATYTIGSVGSYYLIKKEFLE